MKQLSRSRRPAARGGVWLFLLVAACAFAIGCNGSSSPGGSSGSLSGTVTALDGATPIDTIGCDLAPSGGSALSVRPLSGGSVFRNSYTFPFVAPGVYVLKVTAPGYTTVNESVSVSGDAIVDERLVSEAGWDSFMGDGDHRFDGSSGYLMVRALDLQGAPISGVSISVTPAAYETGGYVDDAQAVVRWDGTSTSESGCAFFYRVAPDTELTVTGARLAHVFTTLDRVKAIAGEIVIVTLVGASIDSVTLSPSSATLTAGGTRQFATKVRYVDGSSRDVTSEAAYGCDNPLAGSIDGAGLFTAVSAGTLPQTASVTASFEGVASGRSTVTVNEPPDTTPPTVMIVEPVDGATGVGTTTTVTATFSELLDPTSVTTETFLAGSAAGPLEGTVGCTGTLVTFWPASALQLATTYQVTLTTDVSDLAGNRMAASHTWSFQTVAPE
ncbi:MAG: Ig-like domain-containing protein [Candidatus Riflebacteria bacterium]|nr:Ig-like domain-containing protein [Candidatus Riflebacteria bacterium]